MLAPAYLVAHARTDPLIRAHVEFEIRQFSIGKPIEVIVEEILARDYDAIGFSCYVWNYGVFEQLVPVLKHLRPDTVMIMGGPQLFDQERETLQQIPELDIVVYRHGELAFTEIVRQIVAEKQDWSTVGGILFRQNGQIHHTLARRKIAKFADIASPYLEGVITGRHHNLFVETYRGCPYTCAFCAWGGDEMPKLDLLPLKRVKRELAIMKDMGADMLGFFDSNFNQPADRCQEIFDTILELEQFKTIGISIFAQTLREGLARRMSHCEIMIGVGLQSSNPQVNKVMRRRFRDERMTAGIKLLKAHDLPFTLQVIVGLPGDTYQTIATTLNYALSLEPSTMDAFRLMLLPGTEYRHRAAELDLVYEPRPYHYVISHGTMTTAEINRAERMAQALTTFYNLPETRQEMFRQAAETNESIIDFCDAIGTFIENFDLLDRQELRKGDIIRTKDKPYLLEILQDFKQFRAELAVEMALER